MKAVILAAGKGTRMGELTKSIPKPLLKIRNKTLLEYKMDILPPECTEVVLVIGYLGEKIRGFFGSEYKGRKITYVECEPLGTGYAVWKAQEHLDGTFIVMCGDDLYSREDVLSCLEHPFSSLIYKTDTRSSGGKIVLSEQNYIEDVVEGLHDAGVHIATGLYVLTPEIFSFPLRKVNNGDEYGLPQTILQIKHRGIKAIHASAWHQVTAPHDLVLEDDGMFV